MKLLTITYVGTVYHRRPTAGGMDSEPAGSTLENQTAHIVIADDSQVKYALAWFDQSQSHDEGYERNGHDLGVSIQAILRRPITNLNLV